MVQKKDLYFESQGAKISANIQWPDGQGSFPVIVMVHGLTNSKYTCPMINEAAGKLNSLGFAAFRFDFFGSGESDGIFQDKRLSIFVENLYDAIKFIPQIEKIDPDRVGIWGRSVGAAIAVLGSPFESARATALISPPANLKGIFYKLYEQQGKPEFTQMSKGGAATGSVKGEMQLRRDYFEELGSLEELLYERAQYISNAIVIQGDSDAKVGVPAANKLYQLLKPPKDLIVVPGGDHAYTDKQDYVIGLAANWLLKYLGS
jgi:dipeptidyl aminopeptidase/acylaminoacyl peptidase